MQDESKRTGDGQRPRLSIIIPALENLELTRNCWASVQKNTQLAYEIIVIDNGSQQPLQQEAEKAGLYCVRNERNLGFAAAVNQGLRAARGDFLVVLNNDTVVTPQWDKRLLAHFEAQPQIGLLAPMTNYTNNAQQRLEADYDDEESLTRFSEQVHTQQQGQTLEQNKVAGVCMVLPRAVVEQVGMFDTRFGIGNFEDDDYCLRVRRAGLQVAIAQDVFIHHEGGQTFRLLDIDYEGLLAQNSQLFLDKWSPVLGVQGAMQERNDAALTAPELTVIVVQDEDALQADALENLIGSLPEQAHVHLVCEKSDLATRCEQAGIPVWRAASADLWALVDQRIRAAASPQVLVVSSRLTAPQGWVTALQSSSAQLVQVQPDSKASDEASNESLARAAVLVETAAYEAAGGLSAALSSGVAWDELALRVQDRDQQAVSIKATGVGVAERPGRLWTVDAQELQVVEQLVQVRQQVEDQCTDAALETLEDILEKQPRLLQAHSWKGVLHTARQEWPAARDTYHRVLELDPDSTAAHNNLGCLAYTEGDIEEAAKHFESALHKEPENLEAARNLAHLYFETGDVARALDLYIQIVTVAPHDPQNFLELGGWYEKLGQFGDAADWYHHALQVDANCEEARERLQALPQPSQSAPPSAPVRESSQESPQESPQPAVASAPGGSS